MKLGTWLLTAIAIGLIFLVGLVWSAMSLLEKDYAERQKKHVR